MKKEVFLAISVGFILGLIITFGIWTANKSFHPGSPPPTPTPIASVSPTPAPDANKLSFEISSPADESLVSTNSITVTGKTSPGTPVSLISEIGQIIVVADSSGNFSAEVTLETGYNRLQLSAVDSSGNSASKDILVTYSNSKI